MCIYIYIYICICTYLLSSSYVNIYICVYVYICKYIYIYIYGYVIWLSESDSSWRCIKAQSVRAAMDTKSCSKICTHNQASLVHTRIRALNTQILSICHSCGVLRFPAISGHAQCNMDFPGNIMRLGSFSSAGTARWASLRGRFSCDTTVASSCHGACIRAHIYIYIYIYIYVYMCSRPAWFCISPSVHAALDTHIMQHNWNTQSSLIGACSHWSVESCRTLQCVILAAWLDFLSALCMHNAVLISMIIWFWCDWGSPLLLRLRGERRCGADCRVPWPSPAPAIVHAAKRYDACSITSLIETAGHASTQIRSMQH